MRLRQRAIRETVREDLAPELAAFPDVAPFATPPRELTCRQGCHEYVARQLAFRAGRILFIDPRTAQLGIARLQAGEGLEARQYPCASVAVIMFLGALEAIDAD